MKCPNDNATLLITTRDGIEIDYCPECRGVWLDRGELDKLIERGTHAYGAAPAAPHQPVQPHPSHPPQQQHGYRHDDDDDYYKHGNSGHYGSHGHRKKKESFLGDIFDF